MSGDLETVGKELATLLLMARSREGDITRNTPLLTYYLKTTTLTRCKPPKRLHLLTVTRRVESKTRGTEAQGEGKS
ncbi:hypothetical protein E2C01_030867 [Portunus trituberculatus]|uniref:Uncharacterized protein n=1 Tax=Portunus trituberculatus TaxID=210409 RepID=A0A5B7ET05_PORTR|nr:hypothetical protein [Portunus trituberculatus]